MAVLKKNVVSTAINNNVNQMKGITTMSTEKSKQSTSAKDLSLTPLQENQFNTTLKNINTTLEVMAHKYCNRLYGGKKYVSKDGIAFNDLLQAGKIGVVKAVKKYRSGHVGKGGKTATLESYAATIANYEMWKNYWEQKGFSASEGRTLTAIAKMKERLFKSGRDWKKMTVEEIAGELNMKPATVRKYLQRVYSMDSDVSDNTANTSNVTGKSIYRNTINQSDTPYNIMQNMTSHDDNPSKALERKDLLESVLGCLDADERFVIEHTFGINGAKQMNGVDIGNVLGLKPNSISVKKTKALEKMRKAMAEMSQIS